MFVRSPAQVFHHRLRAGVDVEFFIDGPHIAAHGVNADLHAVGNFLVGITIRQLVEELPFAWRQPRD